MKYVFSIEYKTPTGIPVTEFAATVDSAKMKLECLMKHSLPAEVYRIDNPEIYWVETQMRLKARSGSKVKILDYTEFDTK